MKSFFSTLSYLFHPLFIPIIGLYLLFNIPSESIDLIDHSLYNIDERFKTAVYLIFATLLIIAPGLSMLVMLWSKVIESVHLKSRFERTYAIGTNLVYTTICYTFLRQMLIENPNYTYLLSFVFALVIALSLAFIVNFYIKISLHALGIFGLIGCLVGYFTNHTIDNIYFISVIIIFAGILTTGRVFLKAHNLSEVYLGMLVGFTIEFFFMKYGFYL